MVGRVGRAGSVPWTGLPEGRRRPGELAHSGAGGRGGNWERRQAGKPAAPAAAKGWCEREDGAMSLPNRENPYSFDRFLEWRKGVDYYQDDPFLKKVIRRYCGSCSDEVEEEAQRISKKVSYRWRDLADSIAALEKRPFLVHYDGHHHRIDRIVRPREAEILEKEVFSEALFSEKTLPWVRFVKMFLIYQNGEACVACPLACTDGLVAILRLYADTPVLKRILEHCAEGIEGEFGIGAQYLSEIQGGSDVPSNLLEAAREGDVWRLYGTKFFCSAAHADYALVTAKPTGSEKVALFVVPSWLPGDKEKERRNGYTIDRLKWKMGTCELPTAEITFKGAIAYPVGPLERGLANVVGIVLTLSRLTVGVSSAAGMVRGAREARKYSEFREAFGIPIGRFPLVAGQIRTIETYARRTTAGAFKVYAEFLGLGGTLRGGLATDEPLEVRRKRFDLRELIMLQKITAAWDATEVCRQTMSIFGGHGVMEDFSSLPRFYRDSAVNELWEGPRNVLLTQIYRDLERASEWYPVEEFVGSLLRGRDQRVIDDLSREMREVLEYPNIYALEEEAIEVSRRWDSLCHRVFHEYQDLALSEVG